MSAPETQVFLGQALNDANEKRFLARLLKDLSERGISAVVIANFLAGQHDRQVDFVVVTADHTMLCEVKAFTLPAIGRADGPWKTRLSDGTERRLPDNPYRQAHENMYAFSDELRAFAKTRDVPTAPDGHYYRGIDPILCLFPEVPAGSSIEPHQHVTTLGYRQLFERLTKPGRTVGWSASDWEALVRHLGLVNAADDTEAARIRDAHTALTGDYRRRFAASATQGLPTRVPTKVTANGREISEAELATMLVDQSAVTACGQSGLGKSLLAWHTAVRLANSGHLPVWVHADAFEGTLTSLIVHATSPYTTASWADLIAAAAATGGVVAVFLDGLNEAPDGSRKELLRQLSALRLQDRPAVLITTQLAPALPEPLQGPQLDFALPDEGERLALLQAYGHPELVDQTAFLDTPHELSLAASCAADIGSVTNSVGLLDAYVTHLAPTQTLRHGLREIAAEMFVQFRGSLERRAALQTLHRRAELAGRDIDRLLRSDLLRARQGRIAFAHEDLARFLAAESLTMKAEDGAALSETLAHPRNHALSHLALATETEPGRVETVLSSTTDDALLVAAFSGELGQLGQDVADQLLAAALARALETAREDPPTFRSEAGLAAGWWESETTWSEAERALLRAGGSSLHSGRCLPAVIDLIGETDALCARAIDGSPQAAGSRDLVDAVIAATYGHSLSFKPGLPVSSLVRGCEDAGHRTWGREPLDSGVIMSLLSSTTADGWGAYFMAATLINGGDLDDYNVVPDVLEGGWAAGGYHLRLLVLMMAQRSAATLEGDARARTVEALGAFKTEHLFLSTALVEALAAFEMVDALHSTHDIRDEIADVLACDDKSAAADRARAVVANQFEDARILGPYYEVVADLNPAEKLALVTLALQVSAADDLTTNWMLDELKDLAEHWNDETHRIIRELAVPGDPSEWMGAQWGARTVASALSLSARVQSGPAFQADDAWSAVCALVFFAYRAEHETIDLEERQTPLWEALLDPYRRAALSALRLISSATWTGTGSDAHELLISATPAAFLELGRWSLSNRDQLETCLTVRHIDNLEQYAMDLLGRLGDASDIPLLQTFLDEPALGREAVEAIRALTARSQES